MSQVEFEIDSTFGLSPEQIASYQLNGFIKLSGVFSKASLDHYCALIRQKVQELSISELPIEQRDTYGKAFLQVTNLWTKDKQIQEFVFNRRTARMAAQLMEVEGVRLYHDQALFKEPGGGHTPWHADQYYWPMQTDRCITVWIPLRECKLDMGPLEFAVGSHRFKEGRELHISDESETYIDKIIQENPHLGVAEEFAAGDISFHSGWTFHRAGPNKTSEMRSVMTIIYMDKNMKLLKPRNKHQIADRAAWCPGIEIDHVIDSHLNPIL